MQDLRYEYDAAGNITKVTDNAQQVHYFNNTIINPISTYEYDALYRLVRAEGRELASLAMPTHEDFVNTISNPNSSANAMQNYTHNYSYDKLGNILQQQSVGNWVRDYNYDNATNRLLNNRTGQEYTYDEHGNMLTMPHLSSMVWDYKDQLVSADNGTFTSYYNYDSEGNRSRKVVEKQGGIKEERYYVGNYEIYKITGSLDDHERSTVKINDDTKVFALVEEKTNEPKIVIYQYDNHLGSACLELDDNANIISYEEYHAFGTTSYRSGRSQTEVSLKRYKYCGKERDEETGLYYYGARYYAAWLCRFISTDPMKEERTWVNPYNYCQNNPITRIDPTGTLDDDPPKIKKFEPSGSGATADDPRYTYGNIAEGVYGLPEVTITGGGSSAGSLSENEKSFLGLEASEWEKVGDVTAIVGDIMSIVGIFLTFTPLAPIGAALVIGGRYTAMAGNIISATANFAQGEYGEAAIDVTVSILSQFLPSSFIRAVGGKALDKVGKYTIQTGFDHFAIDPVKKIVEYESPDLLERLNDRNITIPKEGFYNPALEEKNIILDSPIVPVIPAPVINDSIYNVQNPKTNMDKYVKRQYYNK